MGGVVVRVVVVVVEGGLDGKGGINGKGKTLERCEVGV